MSGRRLMGFFVQVERGGNWFDRFENPVDGFDTATGASGLYNNLVNDGRQAQIVKRTVTEEVIERSGG